MNIIDVIIHKREGKKHTRDHIHFLVQQITQNFIPDYQISAWLMAAYLQGLDAEETAWLTLEMAQSGETLDLSSLPKPWVDKHSTGGVGDKTTIIILPLLAACGLTVLKMSGKGLGITGGTVDKLESIEGLNSSLTPLEMVQQAQKVGIAWTSQSKTLAPADKEIYALRDATATVNSLPLITSSILSKKIASGAEHIILDLKCGSGAFTQTYNDAKTLAQMMLVTAKYANLNLKIIITDMNEPLGQTIGNALEIEECIKILKGEVQNRLTDLCLEITALTLCECGHFTDQRQAKAKATETLLNGQAYQKMQQWLIAQGAHHKFFQNPWSFMPQAPYKETIYHDHTTQWIEKWDAHLVGTVVLQLEGGRTQKTDQINHAVGIKSFIQVGQQVSNGSPLYEIHAPNQQKLQQAKEQLKQSLQFSSQKIEPPKLILEIL